MSGAVVHIAPDLSELRLTDASGGGTWRAPAFTLAEGEDAPTAVQWRERAQQAAQWMASQRSIKRRLSAVVIGVDDAVCLWVRSSSLATPVLSASVARLTEEWGESASVWGVEPVYESAREAESGGEHALSVVCHHESLLRLLLDALDKRGVTPGVVLTEWHALALLAGRGAGVTCVMSHDAVRGQVDWAWADGDGLLAGGSVSSGDLLGEKGEASASAAMQRMAMDWLTWSSQLGMSAERAHVVGPGAEVLAQAWKRAYSDRQVEAKASSDGRAMSIEALVKRADTAGTSDDASSSRRCLGRLTRRPTRKTRKRYQAAALACLVGAAAIGSIAVWMNRTVETWDRRANEAREEARERIEDRWPSGIEGRPTSLVSVAAQLYDQDLRESRDVRLPPRPLPIFDELSRVASMLVDVEATTYEEASEEEREGWMIRLQSLKMDEAQGRLNLRVPERRVATRVRERLSDEGALMTWSAMTSGQVEAPGYTGTWQR